MENLDFATVKALSSTIGLAICGTIFIGVAAWAFWPSNKKKLESHANIPLNEE